MKDTLYAFPLIVLVSASNAKLKCTMSRYSSDLKGFKKAALAICDPYFILAAGASRISILWWLSIISNVKDSFVYPVVQARTTCIGFFIPYISGKKNALFAQWFQLSVITFGICIPAPTRI